MSQSIDRLRARQWQRSYDRGLEALSGDDTVDAGAKLVRNARLANAAPREEYTDYGPTPAQLQEVAKARAAKSAAASSSGSGGVAPAAPAPTPVTPRAPDAPAPGPKADPMANSWYTKTAFANIPWWGVILGGVGTIAIGAGIYVAVK